VSRACRFDRRALRELGKPDAQCEKRMLDYLEARMATDDDSRRFGKALKANLSGLWRYLVGQYRIICQIQEGVIVLVLGVWHCNSVDG
jgi:mRNA interferase RelE/StbE